MLQTVSHEFGGQHTEIKLELVERYLKTYCKALRGHFDQLWYFDGFAGTGSRTERTAARDADLFSAATPEQIEQRRGSAQIAIDIDPGFDRLIFIDEKPSHVSALDALRRQHLGTRDIRVLRGDANDRIREALGTADWRRTRAVMFLDPYGMDVEWPTLEAVAETRAIDVWYLFPLSGLCRQAAHDIAKVDQSKAAALTRMLGTNEWREKLYSPVPPMFDLLSGLESIETRQRNANVAGLETYVKQRLETIFPKVLDPFPLPIRKRPQIFSLFCLISNPSDKATRLASSFGNHILNAGRSSQSRPR